MHDPLGMNWMLHDYPVSPTARDHTGTGRHPFALRSMIGFCTFLEYKKTMVLDIVRSVTGWTLTSEN